MPQGLGGVPLRSSEAATLRCRTVAVGIAADGPPAAADVASPAHLRRCRQGDPGFCPGVVLAPLILQPHLTAPSGHLQGVEVVRLLVVLQGPTNAVSPRHDDGFIGDLGPGSDGQPLRVTGGWSVLAVLRVCSRPGEAIIGYQARWMRE